MLSGDAPVQLHLPQVHPSFGDLRGAAWELEPCDPWSLSIMLGYHPLPYFPNHKLLSDCGIVAGTVLTLIRRVLPLAVTTATDGTAKIWDVASGECKQTFSVSAVEAQLSVRDHFMGAMEDKVHKASAHGARVRVNVGRGDCDIGAWTPGANGNASSL